MFDERSHTVKGRLEGRKPIREFFRNIEEDLHVICSLLPLRWSRRVTNELDARKALDPLTSGWIRVTPRGFSIRRTPFSNHDFVSGSWRGGVSFSESSSTTAMRPDGTATILAELAPMDYDIKF